MNNKLPTATELLSEKMSELGFGAYHRIVRLNEEWKDDNLYVKSALAAIESHTAAHTAALRERVKELEAWKESASTVLNELDLQAVGPKLGIKLGESVSKNLPVKIDELKSQLSRYREALESIINESEQLYPDRFIDVAVGIAKEALKQQDDENSN